MKTDAAPSLYSVTKFGAIVKRHSHAAAPPPAADAIAGLVYAFLLWEASTHQANAALERIAKECVDFNELRVCLPEEIAGILGARYPYVEERAMRMRRSLNDIYRREHKVSLDHLSSAGKREQRGYVENLDGMVGFVSSRLLLLHFGQSSVPVDDQLVDLLREAKIVQREDVTAAELAGALAKAAGSVDESLRTHHALVAWADSVWSEDPSSIMKAKKVRTLMQRAADAREQKAREETARQEALKAEAARIEEEKAAAAAKKAARAAARSIEAKPSKADSAKGSSRGTSPRADASGSRPATKGSAKDAAHRSEGQKAESQKPEARKESRRDSDKAPKPAGGPKVTKTSAKSPAPKSTTPRSTASRSQPPKSRKGKQ